MKIHILNYLCLFPNFKFLFSFYSDEIYMLRCYRQIFWDIKGKETSAGRRKFRELEISGGINSLTTTNTKIFLEILIGQIYISNIIFQSKNLLKFLYKYRKRYKFRKISYISGFSVINLIRSEFFCFLLLLLDFE